MKLPVIILIAFCSGCSNTTIDDPVYYARITSTRTYMSLDRVNVTEYWIAKDKFCTLNNQVKTITRKDLGVVYFVNLQSGTVRTEPIKEQQTSSPGVRNLDVRYLGQYYESVFEWNKIRKLAADTVGGYDCEHYICEGDADFDQISLEFFVTGSDDQFLAEMLNNTIMNITGTNNKRSPVFDLIADNNNLVTLKIIETVENPIAPPIITKINVDKLELVKSPEGLFDLPDNLKKTN